MADAIRNSILIAIWLPDHLTLQSGERVGVGNEIGDRVRFARRRYGVGQMK